MTNLKAEYETAQTLLWAMKDELEANEFSDEVFSTKADEFAKQNAKVNRLRSEWERSIKDAHGTGSKALCRDSGSLPIS